MLFVKVNVVEVLKCFVLVIVVVIVNTNIWPFTGRERITKPLKYTTVNKYKKLLVGSSVQQPFSAYNGHV